MAITILQSPVDYSSAHDEAWYNITSTNKTNVGFKYVCDIYIGPTLVARIKSFPQPNPSLNGAFNVSNVIRNYINNYFTPYPTAISFSTNNIYVEFNVKFGEEYGGTLYTNLASSTKKLWNYAVDYLPSIGDIWTGNGLDYQADYEGQVLSKRSNQFVMPNASIGSSYFISHLGPFDVNDVNLDVRVLTNGVWSSWYNGSLSIGNDKLIVYNISPYAIDQYIVGSPIFSANSTAFEFNLNEDTGGTFFQGYVTLVCPDKFTPVTLTFLNSLGGYDSFTFSLVNRQSRNNESKNYESVEWQLDNSYVNYNRFDQHGVFYGGSKTFSTLQTISYKLISDYVSLQDYYWLNDLIRSTEVYLNVGVDRYMPVIVRTTQWTEKKKYTDKVYNLELDIEISAKSNSQYR